MDKDLTALNDLIDDAMKAEKDLLVKEEALAAANKEFANWLKVKKHQDETLEVLWTLVKEKMQEENLREYETPYIKLTLTPSGKYRLAEGKSIDDIPDALCDIKKVLNNKKIKASIELNGLIPAGIESTGDILRKKIKDEGNL